MYEIIKKNAERIQKDIRYERDFTYDYFGFKTLERSYLLKVKGKIVERPQHMLMRVSIGIHKEDLDSAFETYHLMSEKWFTHATPTLFNSGNLSSYLCLIANHRYTYPTDEFMLPSNHEGRFH